MELFLRVTWLAARPSRPLTNQTIPSHCRFTPNQPQTLASLRYHPLRMAAASSYFPSFVITPAICIVIPREVTWHVSPRLARDTPESNLLLLPTPTVALKLEYQYQSNWTLATTRCCTWQMPAFLLQEIHSLLQVWNHELAVHHASCSAALQRERPVRVGKALSPFDRCDFWLVQLHFWSFPDTLTHSRFKSKIQSSRLTTEVCLLAATQIRRFSAGSRRCEEQKKPTTPPNLITSVPYSALTVGIPFETFPNERRVALTPQNAALLLKKGFGRVLIERGAGAQAKFTDEAYEKAGATLVDRTAVWQDSDILLKVRAPLLKGSNNNNEVAALREGSTLISFLYPAQNKELVNSLAARRVTSFAMDMIPRISRAQVFDALRYIRGNPHPTNMRKALVLTIYLARWQISRATKPSSKLRIISAVFFQVRLRQPGKWWKSCFQSLLPTARDVWEMEMLMIRNSNAVERYITDQTQYKTLKYI